MNMRCLSLFLVFAVSGSASGSGFLDRFVDPLDGRFDVSEWIESRTGFLPVPILITEPAVGYGGGLALAFFHGPLASGEGAKSPSVSAVAFGGTENGTWFLGGGHLGIWREDRIRYLGGVGLASANLDYYGNGGAFSPQPVRFNTEAFGLMQEIMFRLGETRFFAGVGYRLVDTRNRFHRAGYGEIPGIPELDFDSRSAGLSLILNYDSRDNLFTPSHGLDLEIELGDYGRIWGGDDEFRKYGGHLKYYRPLGRRWTLGLRLDVDAVDGKAPFYEYPYLEMRGVKVLRYQGRRAALAEAELRWRFHPRWFLVGFGGAGRTWSEGGRGSGTIGTQGIGFRYLIARRLGLQMGIDVARGPEEIAFYIQVGSAWLR